MVKRIINVSVLPGEPTDGSGKVCVHLFVPDDAGPFVESHILRVDDVADDGSGRPTGRQVVARPTRGRLACDPKRTVAPTTRNNVTTVTFRTDDPRGATCLKCLASKDYDEMMRVIATLEAGR